MVLDNLSFMFTGKQKGFGVQIPHVECDLQQYLKTEAVYQSLFLCDMPSVHKRHLEIEVIVFDRA